MSQSSSILRRALVAALSFVSVANAIPTISAKGSKFFTSDGNQWYVKGVAYQLLPNDPLVDTTQCTLDAALMKQLGANAIRVYHVDPSADHDGCMAAFEAAGIYTFIDLDTFSDAIVQTAPAWTAAQLGGFEFVMDTFQQYDNLAGFFIGNEVINTVGPNTLAAPYIKASVADLKAYRDSKGYRAIPIGYSHADVAGLRPILQDYLVCGDDASQSIDFFGLNAYEWCGASSYETSGYAELENQTLTYPVPIFMSETGCIVPEPRLFTDQSAILGQMADTWSGAIVYEWIQEENHYGIITYGGGNTEDTDYSIPSGGIVRSGTPTPITPDFANLKTQWATLTPTGTAMADYTPTNTAPACPPYTAGTWEVSGNVPLPTLGLKVAIPTSSALALANYGLATYSTPAAVIGSGSTTGESSISAASTPTVSSSSASTNGFMTVLAASTKSSGSSSSGSSAKTTGVSSSSGTGTASAVATSTGAATGGKEVAAMGVGLFGVLFTFFYFL